ncbi:potassium channel family protein [Mycolicibacterium litorale]|uniref:potassium channel family protein n=1 Tax=Mycolicibacterium litorale TaxID=758802 RepID=UPI0016235603|nr:potassium channel family protein [Mycolicibacterium litorale]
MAEPTRLERYETRSEWPLAAVALLFLALFSVDVLLQPRGAADTAIEFGMKLTYFAFVIDYLSRLSLARPRGRWFVRHLFDLAIVALPFLRPLRLLSLAVVVKVLQRAVGQSIRGRVIVYTACGATVIIYAAALAILEVERGNPDAKIANFGDAVWWAITTVTTVGYGEFFPVTFQGRMVAVALMIGGISLVGVVTATLASWIIQRVAEEDTASQAATVAHVEQLRAEVRQLREALEGGGTLDRSTPMP